MRRYRIPEDYRSSLDLIGTQRAIKLIKDTFERKLAERLNLLRVSAPLFVRSDSGLNDNLSGVEQPVRFSVSEEPGVRIGAEIVQSLAKWKRQALASYGFEVGTGLYTDMNAIRPDEIPDNIHSIYVDQWDWELVISREQRNTLFLEATVEKIFRAYHDLEDTLAKELVGYEPILPETITFLTTRELESLYPADSPKDREKKITKEKGAVFLEQIGTPLSNGAPHDSRSPDYDDWMMNGDILVWNEVLDDALELSSMGIRVDSDSLLKQLEIAGATERLRFPYHRSLMSGELPLTIGGGIGQSRTCLFFLRKAHIGEVQSSIWPENMIRSLANRGVALL